MEDIICKKEVELKGTRYIAYLKKVATRLDTQGNAKDTIVKAYIRKKNEENAQS